MKKKCNKKKHAFSIVIFFLLAVTVVKAQTYFAGSGAGAGNSGTLVTGVGTFALGSSNSGTANAAFGSNALFKNTIGTNNGAFGANSLYNNTTGSYNVAVGKSALYSNVSGANNTSAGYNSLYANTSGYSNTAFGSSALKSNSSGSNNTAVGDSALLNNTTGYKNTSVGFNSLRSNSTGIFNTAVGQGALLSNTTGYSNSAIGVSSLGSNTTGIYNTATGVAALYRNIFGSNNTASGWQSLYNNTGGHDNTAYGYRSSNMNENGYENTSVGVDALYSNLYGDYNTAIGSQALPNSQAGNVNTAIGYGALGTGNLGDSNVAIGGWAGMGNSSYSNCTFLGSKTGATGAVSYINSTAIGFDAKVDSSNKVIIGNISVTSIGGQVGWTTYSDRSLKTNITKSTLGLEFIKALNPVTYNYKAEGQKNILYTGLIAQEVDEAAKKAGVPFSAIDKNGKNWGIRYGELTVPLIKAMQEMEEKHSAEVEALQSRIEKLEQAVAMLIQKQNGGNISDKNSLLFQNQPNPSNNGTAIRYMLQNGVEKASIIIRDVKGRALKQFDIKSPGSGSILMKAGELAAGTYTYSLIIKGQAVDSKLMIITH